MLKIALAGAGTLGGDHARNFAQIDGCQVAVIFDVVKPNAERLAAEIGAEVADSEDRIYADDIDIVVVTTPTPFDRRPMARAGRRSSTPKMSGECWTCRISAFHAIAADISSSTHWPSLEKARASPCSSAARGASQASPASAS